MASETGPIKVLHVGLGPIGAGVVRQVAERKGSASSAPSTSIRRRSDAISARSPASAARCASRCRTTSTKTIKAAKPDVVVLCTSSSLKKVLPQIEDILKLKVPIVSTTEELAYPTKAQRSARAIDAAARRRRRWRCSARASTRAS